MINEEETEKSEWQSERKKERLMAAKVHSTPR